MPSALPFANQSVTASAASLSAQQSPLELLIDDTFLIDQMALFNTLIHSVRWEGSMAARRTASFGVPYNYAQMTYPAVPMHSALVPVVEQLHEALGVRFNNCLLNFYETGRSKMGFHADDTTHLQPNTGVAIVSLGHPRKITYRSKADKTLQHSFTLLPGSLLYMSSAIQSAWVHAIKKQKGVGPRISLTWRAFIEA
jgi:alkylated DNA repair dioxygenase AlkB